MCSDGMLEQMGDEELVDVLCCDMSWDEKREQLIELTKDNKDNHSAYIISITEVVKEEGDEALCDWVVFIVVMIAVFLIVALTR